MENIIIDCGTKEYAIGNGILSFNAADFNVYDRFMEIAEKIPQVEADLVEKGKAAQSSEDALRILREADRKIKDLLQYVFGQHNDFDKMVRGVNMFAVATNGERVITNLLNALTPIMENGIKEYVQANVQSIKAQRDN